MLQNSTPTRAKCKLGRYHVDDHNEKRLSERHFLKNIPAAEGKEKAETIKTMFCV